MATSALAAGAALIASPGAAGAALPGADAAADGYADALNKATLGMVGAINTTAPVYGKVFTAWNGIPVAGSLVHFTQHASLSDVSSFDQLTTTVPLLGTLYNQPIAYTDGGNYPTPWGNYDRVLEYTGLFGDARTVSGWNWGSDWGASGNSVGAGAYAWLDHYTDPLGLTTTGAQIWSPELDLGNGGFAVYGPGAWIDSTVKKLGGGDLGIDSLFGFSLDDDGIWLTGPSLYAGPQLLDKAGLDVGLFTGSIGLTKDGLQYYGPSITNEHWNGPATVSTPIGDLVGGVDLGDGTVGPATKINAPFGSAGVDHVLGGNGAVISGDAGTWTADKTGADVSGIGSSSDVTVPGLTNHSEVGGGASLTGHPSVDGTAATTTTVGSGANATTSGATVEAGLGTGTPNGVDGSVLTPDGQTHDFGLGD